MTKRGSGREGRGPRRSLAAVASALVLPTCLAQAPPAPGSARFVLDGNRVHAEVSFVRPDGTRHRALAFVDMGSPSMEIAATLAHDLRLDPGGALKFLVGDLLVSVPAREVTVDPGEPSAMGGGLKVEAVLPAGVLQRYDVVLDYARQTLTLARPGTIHAGGTPTPFRRNPGTGLIAVDARIDGKTFAVTIDNGSAYSWFRQDAAAGWLEAHPVWQRGVGAVGASNMTMAGDGAEASGILMRIPEVGIGPLALENVSVLAAGRGKGPGGVDLFDWYSTKNAVPVIGWIGGNVLKAFRLTVDYRNGLLYWLRQSGPDPTELDQVGLTLTKRAGEYIVAAVATRNGKPTVDGVEPGDKLLRIDALETRGATKGAIYDALHGKPGDLRLLVLERRGVPRTVRVTVTPF